MAALTPGARHSSGHRVTPFDRATDEPKLSFRIAAAISKDSARMFQAVAIGVAAVYTEFVRGVAQPG